MRVVSGKLIYNDILYEKDIYALHFPLNELNTKENFPDTFQFSSPDRRYMAEILPIRRKTLSNCN